MDSTSQACSPRPPRCLGCVADDSNSTLTRISPRVRLVEKNIHVSLQINKCYLYQRNILIFFCSTSVCSMSYISLCFRAACRFIGKNSRHQNTVCQSSSNHCWSIRIVQLTSVSRDHTFKKKTKQKHLSKASLLLAVTISHSIQISNLISGTTPLKQSVVLLQDLIIWTRFSSK